MKLHRRHYSVLLTLGIYWPVLFWLTHSPVQQVARQSGMSDKTMHLLAYFVLTFLIWFAVSPFEKVRFTKLKSWILLLIVALYGIVDEYVQGRVGRSADFHDFMADLFGILLGLGMLSVFGFWSALLTVSIIFIFVISNMSYLLSQYPQYHFNTVFHFTAYSTLTLIWIQHIDRYTNFIVGKAGWLLYSLGMPLAVMLTVTITAPIFSRSVWWVDVATALFGICTSIFISNLVFKVSRRKKAESE